MVNVMIVEDDPLARRLFTMYVEGSKDYELAYAIESAAIAETYCLSGKIDLILMDVCTAGHVSGLEAAIKIKAKYPNIKIIIVTSQPECSFIQRAKEGNIDSFWYKTTEEKELLEVMDMTVNGESVYPSDMPVIEIGDITADRFTELELKILRELTTGDTNKIIAERLHLSPRTVENNVQRMLEKTGFPSKTKLACAATESGIVIKDM